MILHKILRYIFFIECVLFALVIPWIIFFPKVWLGNVVIGVTSAILGILTARYLINKNWLNND